jgi:hypothetical protein
MPLKEISYPFLVDMVYVELRRKKHPDIYHVALKFVQEWKRTRRPYAGFVIIHRNIMCCAKLNHVP